MNLTDVKLVNVGIHKGKLGLVVGVLQAALDDLVHGGDASTASDHEEVRGEVGVVDELALGTPDQRSLSNLEVGEVTRDVSLLIGLMLGLANSFAHLHNEVKVSLVVVESGGGVAALNILAIDVGLDADVLANGQAERVCGAGESKPIPEVSR